MPTYSGAQVSPAFRTNSNAFLIIGLRTAFEQHIRDGDSYVQRYVVMSQSNFNINT